MKRNVWWALGVVLVGLAMVVCLLPMPPRVEPLDLNDKVAHMIGHAALAVYFTGLVERRRWWKIFVFLLMFGIVVEFAQHYMNVGRQGDVRDVIGNVCGALAGLLLGYVGFSRWPDWIAALLGKRAAP